MVKLKNNCYIPTPCIETIPSGSTVPLDSILYCGQVVQEDGEE